MNRMLILTRDTQLKTNKKSFYRYAYQRIRGFWR